MDCRNFVRPKPKYPYGMKCLLILSLSITCLISTLGQQSATYQPVSQPKQENQNAVLIPSADENMNHDQQSYSNQVVMINNLHETKGQTTVKSENAFENAGIRIFPLRTPDFINVLLQESAGTSLTGEFVLPNGTIGKSVSLEALFNEINLAELEPGNYRFRIKTANGKLIAETTITREKATEP